MARFKPYIAYWIRSRGPGSKRDSIPIAYWIRSRGPGSKRDSIPVGLYRTDVEDRP